MQLLRMNVATLSAKPQTEDALGLSNACNNALQPQEGVQHSEEISTQHHDHEMSFCNPTVTSETPDAANGSLDFGEQPATEGVAGTGSQAIVHLQMTAQPASPSEDDAMQLVTSPRTPGGLQSLTGLQS